MSQSAATTFDWSELAFGSKKPLRELHATFIAAPRDISERRFLQLIKQYLPAGQIVLGIAKEEYIDGFTGQPHFRTLQQAKVQSIIDKVNSSKSPNKIYSLHYFQREVDHIIEKLALKRILLINGSWQYTFHNRSTYYLLANNSIKYERITPFADEQEAIDYAASVAAEIAQVADLPNPALKNSKSYISDENGMLHIAGRAAIFSYDYSFQTGTALGRRLSAKSHQYELLAYSHNAVVPYPTFALHHGSLRENNFSPANDLNHYDTVHAEVELLIKAQKEKIDLAGTTLFINLLPCPTCARMLSETDIEEFVYREDHSAGYAVSVLERAGKRVRRVVSE